jgi:putative transposase
MIEKNHSELSIRRQCALLEVNRNRLVSRPKLSAEDQEIMRDLDELHTRWPYYGQRKLVHELRKRDWGVGRKRVRRLMRLMGMAAVAPKPKTSVPDDNHRKYPYLLRDLTVDRPDQVWCTDITYIPLSRGFAYLVAVMDWHTRAVLSWRISNTLDTSFCLEALHEACRVAGCSPEIFNTDQGCQFTSEAWIEAVESMGTKVSMDGRGRWIDNVFIERLWRSLKCEDIYLKDYRSVPELEQGVSRWMKDYNHERIHEGLDYECPWSLYRPQPDFAEAA